MQDRPSQTAVLIVDDDDGIRSMLQLAFSARGYRVDAIGDRQEAWIGHPDVVVVDALLDGETADEFLAETGLDDGTPVILMTAANDVRKIVANGRYSGIVRKPFDLEELFETVESALGVRATR